jgi:hypothetical protein
MTIAAELPSLSGAPLAKREASIPQITDLSERISWKTPTPGLWVGETPSSYLGMVDRVHDGFVATGQAGNDLGAFGSLEDAKLAVYTSWFLPSE